MHIDDEAFFVGLADELNAHPEQFKVLGDADMVAALVMRKTDGDFAVRIAFEGLRVEAVAEIPAADAALADYYLDGPFTAWQAMFDDILAALPAGTLLYIAYICAPLLNGTLETNP